MSFGISLSFYYIHIRIYIHISITIHIAITIIVYVYFILFIQIINIHIIFLNSSSEICAASVMNFFH